MATVNNRIDVYQNNSKTIGCVVVGVSDVSGFIPYLTVKKKTGDADSVLSKTGTVVDASGTLLFNLTTIDTSMNYGDYIYDVTIEKDTTVYTVVKDKFIVVDGVRY